MWTLVFGHHEDHTPSHAYEATREAAMAAFAKSCRNRRAPSPEKRALQACDELIDKGASTTGE
jgi:hypothetical protein